MKKCLNCKEVALSQKNIFSSQYRCKACGAVCTPSTRSRAVNHIIINVLPVLGIVLAFFTKSITVFFLFAVAMPLLLSWWHQNTAKLHIVHLGK
jgi:hypothetical protein